jgi:hypothetical protein
MILLHLKAAPPLNGPVLHLKAAPPLNGSVAFQRLAQWSCWTQAAHRSMILLNFSGFAAQ